MTDIFESKILKFWSNMREKTSNKTILNIRILIPKFNSFKHEYTV